MGLFVNLREGEWVMVNDAKITFTKIKSKTTNEIQLVIEAPKETKIIRGTLVKKIENKLK